MKEIKEIVASEESMSVLLELVDVAFGIATKMLHEEQDAFSVLFAHMKDHFHAEGEEVKHMESFAMGVLQGIAICEANAEMKKH